MSALIDTERRPPRANRMTAAPVTNMARVASMKGAPRIAPTPISDELLRPDPAKIGPMMAMTGMSVSGIAVAMPASTLPTAPSARFSLCPNHSIPLVNSSAPSRMTSRAPTRIGISTQISLRVSLRAWASGPGSGSQVLRSVGQERDLPGALESGRQHALVPGAGTGLAPRLDLCPLGQVPPEPIDLLVVDRFGLLNTEVADLASPAISVVVRR